jgi:4-carboxymuconolactone decarboxylase
MKPMAPRISPVTDPDDDVRDRLAKAPSGPDGNPLNLFGTLAHRPRLMSGINALGGSLMFKSSLSDRDRELVILRAATLSGAQYEIHHHRGLGARAGLLPEEIDAAVDTASPHEWSRSDRALLEVVAQLDARADVDEQSWAALDGILDDEQRIELLVLIGFYRLLAGVLNGARVQVDESSLDAAR